MPDHFSLHDVGDPAVDSRANVVAAIARQSRADNQKALWTAEAE